MKKLILMPEQQNIIIYNTVDGKASASLYAKDGSVWMNQNQLAELFATSKQYIGQYIEKVLEDRDLDKNEVVKNYFTTAADGKDYNVTYYALDMVLAIGFRVRSKCGTQFRIWTNQNLKEYMEPLAKVMSGNLLPHFGVFPNWIFKPWNHHASQPILKVHSKWDCILFTRNFASGSLQKSIMYTCWCIMNSMGQWNQQLPAKNN